MLKISYVMSRMLHFTIKLGEFLIFGKSAGVKELTNIMSVYQDYNKSHISIGGGFVLFRCASISWIHVGE